METTSPILSAMAWPGVIDAYRSFLPVTPRTPVVTLREGGTPLVESTRIGPRLGVRLYFKVEALNPSGSFKDRGMTVAVSRAVEAGRRAVVCASTGNTAASAAAYAARAGIACVVILPAGVAAAGKLVQVAAHGGQVLLVDGSFDEALATAVEVADRLSLGLVNSLNPDRIAGQQTAAFEVCDALGGGPDLLVLPVGNAGNITAYHRGFAAYRQAGRVDALPRLIGVQAAGAAPLVDGHAVPSPRTVASAIRIGAPASREGALEAVRATGGRFLKVTDEAILRAQARLAAEEGLFVEPASAAAVAGLEAMLDEVPLSEETVVCVLTGHGLKDPERVPPLRLGSPVSPAGDAVTRAVSALLP